MSKEYYKEIEEHIVNGDLTRGDILDFLSEGRISTREFVRYVDTFNWIEDN